MPNALYVQVDETQEVVESLLACEFLGLARMQDVNLVMERAIAEVAAEAEEVLRNEDDIREGHRWEGPANRFILID